MLLAKLVLVITIYIQDLTKTYLVIRIVYVIHLYLMYYEKCMHCIQMKIVHYDQLHKIILPNLLMALCTPSDLDYDLDCDLHRVTYYCGE